MICSISVAFSYIKVEFAYSLGMEDRIYICLAEISMWQDVNETILTNRIAI